MRFEYSTIVAALAVSAQAQTRNLIGYIGSNTGCGPGNVIAYDNLDSRVCAFQDGTLFGSARLTNADGNEVLRGFVPGGDPNAGVLGNCANTAAESTVPGQCITDGPNGFTGMAWIFLQDTLARDVAQRNRSRQTLIFADGKSFDLLALAEDETKDLLAVARVTGNSTAVPRYLWKAAV